MPDLVEKMESGLSAFFGNVKIVEKVMNGMQGSYVELFTIVSLGLLAIIPVIVSGRRRQFYRRITQLLGIAVFIFVVFTCLGVFGMIRNFQRGLSEIGRENIVALYYMSVPLTILVMSMLFGATFCGWICPTGSIQEFISEPVRKWWISRKRQGFPFSPLVFAMTATVAAIFFLWIFVLASTRTFFLEDTTIYWSEALILIMLALVWKQKEWDSRLRSLKILSFWVVVVGAAVGIRITSPVHLGFAKVYDPASFLSTVMVALGALVIPRIWCRYLCPWKVAIAWASKHSVRKIVFDEGKCVACGKCDEVCENDAIARGKINHKECLSCFKCIDICPSKALDISDDWKCKGKCR